MMKRTFTITAVTLGVFGMVAFGLWRVPCDPEYQGRRLSTYLEAFAQDSIQLHRDPPFGWIRIFSPSAERDRAWQALPEFGTNALPLVFRWLTARDTGFERWLDWFERKQSRIRFHRLSSWQKQMAAMVALERLGGTAEPLLPKVARLLDDPASARTALVALSWIHSPEPGYILAITNVLIHSDTYWSEIDAIAALSSLGSKSIAAAPLLIDRLYSTNDNVRSMAAVGLARMGADPENLVSLVATNLQRSSSSNGYPAPTSQMNLWALGEFGSGARAALPVISSFVNDPDPRISETARTTLKKVMHSVNQVHSAAP